MLPYDRWEGYVAERNEILNFIRDNGIENVVFLTTDNHGTMQGDQVSMDFFADRATIANEMVTGPIGTEHLPARGDRDRRARRPVRVQPAFAAIHP